MVQGNRIEEFTKSGNEVCSEAQHQVEQAYHRTKDLVRENPVVSTLTVFSAGVGLGLLLTCALLPSRRRLSSSSTWSDTYDHASKHIADAISKVMPEALQRRMS